MEKRHICTKCGAKRKESLMYIAVEFKDHEPIYLRTEEELLAAGKRLESYQTRFGHYEYMCIRCNGVNLNSHGGKRPGAGRPKKKPDSKKLQDLEDINNQVIAK